jgi:hypothetical protein
MKKQKIKFMDKGRKEGEEGRKWIFKNIDTLRMNVQKTWKH